MSVDFDNELKKNIWKVIKNKPVINAGVIFAPHKKFINLCLYMKKLVSNNNFGSDQIILNYYLYKNQFILLDEKYNFMIAMSSKGVIIKKGVFYKKNGEKAVIVHNAGQIDQNRSIKNFGYGRKFNQIKHLLYGLKKTQYKMIEAYKKIFSD